MQVNTKVVEPDAAARTILWDDVKVGEGTVDRVGDIRQKVNSNTYLIFLNPQRLTTERMIQVWNSKNWCGQNSRHCTIGVSVEATINAK